MRIIILQVSSGPGDVDAHKNAHALYAVSEKMRKEWHYPFTILHTDEYSLLIAGEVDFKEQADVLQAQAKEFYEEEK